MITHVTEKETQLAHLLREMTEALDRTTKERDALKTDAERYRWLRESRHTSATAMTFCDVLDEWTPWAEPKYLDEAIDTQLQAALRKS
jgi:hypothetical protein